MVLRFYNRTHFCWKCEWRKSSQNEEGVRLERDGAERAAGARFRALDVGVVDVVMLTGRMTLTLPN